jgi:hypothetical protein
MSALQQSRAPLRSRNSELTGRGGKREASERERCIMPAAPPAADEFMCSQSALFFGVDPEDIIEDITQSVTDIGTFPPWLDHSLCVISNR